MRLALLLTFVLATAAQAQAPYFFNTGNPDGLMGMVSRPDGNGLTERETADDFLLTNPVSLTHATFFGLLPSGASLGNISGVNVEIYRVFPKDSQDPPSGNVPTRTNSPSDVAFETRTLGTDLLFHAMVVSSSFTVANSVLNGINPKPNQTTGGEGAVTGEEVQFDVDFTKALDLPADHYFFVPQVLLTSGSFFWLSAARPIGAGGTPFTPDLQTWIRSAALDPDWLRVGTDVVGGATPPTFNAAFSLTGTTTPEPASLLLLASGLGGMGWFGRRRKKA